MTENNRWPMFSEAMFLAALTGFGYAVAFAYEIGYANAYGIPAELVDIRLTSIFLAIFGMLLSQIILYNLVDAVYPVFSLTRSPVVWYFRVPIALALIAVPFAVVLGWRNWQIIALIYGFIV